VVSLLFMLVVFSFGHFLADYPLQGDFLARAKNHRDPIPHTPWRQALFAHAFIHASIAGFIALAFLFFGGSMIFMEVAAIVFVGELVSHAVTDYRKCAGELTFNQDQTIHLSFKLLWGLMVMLSCL